MKTINIKIISALFFILCFPFLIPLKAQTDTEKKAMCDDYLRAPYIFEGKVDSSKYFTIQTGERSYVNFMAYFVEVKKVIQGNIQIGTIEIMDPTPGIIYRGNNDVISWGQPSDGRSGIIGQGLFFCRDKAVDMTKSYYKNSNNKTLSYSDGISSKNGEIKTNPTFRDLGTYFSSFSDFYSYLNVNYGMNIENK